MFLRHPSHSSLTPGHLQVALQGLGSHLLFNFLTPASLLLHFIEPKREKSLLTCFLFREVRMIPSVYVCLCEHVYVCACFECERNC